MKTLKKLPLVEDEKGLDPEEAINFIRRVFWTLREEGFDDQRLAIFGTTLAAAIGGIDCLHNGQIQWSGRSRKTDWLLDRYCNFKSINSYFEVLVEPVVCAGNNLLVGSYGIEVSLPTQEILCRFQLSVHVSKIEYSLMKLVHAVLNESFSTVPG